jgi:hypothetical protein
LGALPQRFLESLLELIQEIDLFGVASLRWWFCRTADPDEIPFRSSMASKLCWVATPGPVPSYDGFSVST